jgi:hypothetical protein
MDEDAYGTLQSLKLPQIVACSLAELEESNQELRDVRSTRSTVEYYYTCGPAFLLFLLRGYPEINLLTYLDSDLYFFSQPKPLFNELNGYSIGIIEHRLPNRLSKLKRFGTYNVGWVSFRRDESGLQCLRWWANRCIEWCYDRVEGEKFADQKYLDEFPRRFELVRAIRHKGANVAPWNVGNVRITSRNNSVWVDGQPLIFFHFQGFKVITPWLFDTNFGSYRSCPSSVVRQKIFDPYIQELRLISREVGPVMSLRNTDRNRSRGFGILTRAARMFVQVSIGLVWGSYMVNFPKASSTISQFEYAEKEASE